jgi:ATP-dependent Lhr-like helicase
VGATVILRNGELIAYMRRNNPNLQVFLPADEPDRSNAARDLAVFLASSAQQTMRQDQSNHRGGLLISTINGRPIQEHWLARFLLDAGFQPAPRGFNVRRILPPVSASTKELQ